MDNTLITVVVPVYNVENYISQCVNSIINQTYYNLQIILIDDGSTDLSGKICEEFVKKDNRVICIHQKNGGLAKARNTGIENAKGSYISFIDSDDYINTKMIESLYNSIIKYNSQISVCNGTSFYQGSKTYHRISASKTNKCISGNKGLCEIIDNWISACNKLYNHDIFDHLRFKEGCVNEDCYFMAELFDKVDSISFTTYVGYCYRKGRYNSIMTKCFHKCDMDFFNSGMIIYNKLLQLGYTQTAYKRFNYQYQYITYKLALLSLKDLLQYRSEMEYMQRHLQKVVLRINESRLSKSAMTRMRFSSHNMLLVVLYIKTRIKLGIEMPKL